MNCDQAFECLTDPELSSGSELRAHLDGCPRCRDMADILEPALRFVTGEASTDWIGSAWDVAPKIADRTSQPFLTEQAVRVAEEAASSLLARNRRRMRARRNRWLAATLLAPVIALALFLSEPKSSQTPPEEAYSPVGPALGPCTRMTAAMTKPAGDADREISAYEVVRACNVCHLLDRPHRADDQEHLKLQPVKATETGGLWQPVAPDKAHASAGISLRWQMAAIALHERAC